MRAVVIAKHGPPSVLEVRDRPDPSPAAGELLIDVKASGVNFADVMARLGFYPDAPKTPCVVGYEVAGVVSGLGEGVEGFAIGDRVLAGTRFGGYSERVATSAGNAMRIPDRLDFTTAAAVPVNYTTAWAALIRYGSLQPGERALVQMAAGGVGIAATQIAKRHGAEVWGAASPGKHERLLELGVDHPVDYTRRGWWKGLPEFDVILDAVGGRSFRRGYDLLAAGGRMVCFGAAGVVSGNNRNFVSAARTAASMPRFNMIKQMEESKAVIGLNMLRLWDAHGSVEPWLEPLHGMLSDGTIDPVVAGVFPFEQAAEAHRMLAERRNVGKVLLEP